MYKPIFDITPELLRLITEAVALRTWIHESVIGVPWLPALQKETTLRLTHSSTAIEGNTLSLHEVEAVVQGHFVSASKREQMEVSNQYAALRWIARKKSNTSIRESELLQLHRLITRDLLSPDDSGKYKTRQNRVINSKGITVYTPPSPEKARLMTLELLHWLNGTESKRMHAIISSAVAHYQLVSIHPFLDGNGRASRALAIWLLYTRGFDTDHICALDEYFIGDHQRYYDKIEQAREMDHDLTNWLEYVAQGVVYSLGQTKERILSLQISHKGSKIHLTKRQEDVLRLIRDHGHLKSPDIEKELKLSRARVSQLMAPLVKAGLVIRRGQTRATTYHLK